MSLTAFTAFAPSNRSNGLILIGFGKTCKAPVPVFSARLPIQVTFVAADHPFADLGDGTPRNKVTFALFTDDPTLFSKAVAFIEQAKSELIRRNAGASAHSDTDLVQIIVTQLKALNFLPLPIAEQEPYWAPGSSPRALGTTSPQSRTAAATDLAAYF